MSHDGRVEVVVVDDEEDGTLVETPTRCNNTKNNREERVRMSRAIRTGVAGSGGGLELNAVVAVRRKRRFMEVIIGDDDDGPSTAQFFAFILSLSSGKRNIIVDGREVHFSQAGSWEWSFDFPMLVWFMLV